MRIHHSALVLTGTLLTGAVLVASPTAAAADDTVQLCAGRVVTISGTAGKDHLVGTPGPDVIAGLAGNDRIEGLGGDDVICGGDGADRLDGGDGADELLAGRAKRYDTRAGSGYRPDRLVGGPGDDSMDIGPEPVDRGLGISGEISFPGALAGVVVDLAAGTATGEGEDRITPRGGLRVVGTAAADEMSGSAEPEELVGLGGPDELRGGGGEDRLYGDDREATPGEPGSDDDVLVGGAGKDVVMGAFGADVVRGGTGLDLLQAEGAGAPRVLGGAGDDIVMVTLGTADGVLLSGGQGRDTVTIELDPGVSPRRVVVHQDDGTLDVAGDPVGRTDTVERFYGAAGVRLTVSP